MFREEVFGDTDTYKRYCLETDRLWEKVLKTSVPRNPQKASLKELEDANEAFLAANRRYREVVNMYRRDS